MSYRNCSDCGAPFWCDQEWKTRCLPCWKVSKNARSPGDADVRQRWYALGYTAGYAAATAATREAPAPLDKTRLRELLQLTHPDRHGNSELSTKVTAWLNELRRGVRQ